MGWIKEVDELLKKQKENSLLFPSLNSIGYKQICSYVNNEISFDDMKEEVLIKTRQFAKRQRQWFDKENIDLIVGMDSLKQGEISQILCCIFKVIL